MSQNRIREWYDYWNGDVCVSFSGGKDSTVLAHLVHDIYPDVPLVFVNTGLEFPEIRQFAKNMGAEIIQPKMSFADVILKYGYPIISKEVSCHLAAARSMRKDIKHATREKFLSDENSLYSKKRWLPLLQETNFLINDTCCKVIKKSPFYTYTKKHKLYTYVGTLAEESQLRLFEWLKTGCNAYDSKKKTSKPMSFWTEQDVLHYIKENDLEIASVYGDIVTVDADGMEYDNLLAPCGELKCTGCQRTGCTFCGFGCHLEKGETRFQRLAKTHPKQYEYCMRGGQWVDNPKYDPTAPKYDGDWLNWNPKKIWTPSKEGLGMKHVFDEVNAIYGKGFIRYE